MKLYTIENDRTKWVNNLYGYEGISLVEYSDEEIAEFRKAKEGYVIKNVYSWSDDDGDHGGGTYYNEIKDEWMLISGGKLVGVCFLTRHYSHSMSNVYNYEKNAGYIDKASSRRGERWYDYCEIYENTPSSESECKIYIIPRSDMPSYASFNSRPPLSNILN